MAIIAWYELVVQRRRVLATKSSGKSKRGVSGRSIAEPSVTSKQLAASLAVVKWYLSSYFRREDEPGTPALFLDPRHVGSFAVDRVALANGQPDALFRLLIAMAMFQRRQDVQILRILRGIGPEDAVELSTASRLLALADGGTCREMESNDRLQGSCDLAKDPETSTGCCSVNPSVSCHLKRHTVLLKRYGHFGKVPTSIAITIREAGASDLGELRARILQTVRDPVKRAERLEAALCEAWRVNQKIACMFLSAISNPDLSPHAAPWSDGIDWTRFIVVDSNVDLFLKSIGYRGLTSYDARREFISALARRIDLRRLDQRLRRYNPRLVQQAFYVFMSIVNRRVTPRDCMHVGANQCAKCPGAVRERCPARRD